MTSDSQTTTRSNERTALDPRLAGLLDADDPDRYADEHDLRVRDGSVLIVIVLANERPLPDEFGLSVEAQYDDLVQAWAPIDDLEAIAEHQNVTLVRPPRQPSLDSGSSNDSET